jgi:hypothetical protein
VLNDREDILNALRDKPLKLYEVIGGRGEEPAARSRGFEQ